MAPGHLLEKGHFGLGFVRSAVFQSRAMLGIDAFGKMCFRFCETSIWDDKKGLKTQPKIDMLALEWLSLSHWRPFWLPVACGDWQAVGTETCG